MSWPLLSVHQCCGGCNGGFGVGAPELPGCVRLELAQGVVPLNPREAVFEGMLAGWARQQRSRFLREDSTIGPRAALVRRLAEFAGQYLWEWEPAEAEAFISHLRSGARPVAVSTARGYETALRLFCEYVTDPRYEWAEVCEGRFGRRPVQVFHEWNSVVHVTEYEGAPGRRPLTYDEVQALFDAADGRVEQIRARGRKGALAALRDAAVLKTVYAYGLRRREASGLDLTDLRRNPKAPQYGRCGGLFVRWGKASKGSPPRRRTVLTVPEMDWITGVLEHWISEVRPVFGPGPLAALWVTERAAWASDLPPAVLASLLGVHIQTTVNWASHTRRDWTTYIADRVSTPARVHHPAQQASPAVPAELRRRRRARPLPGTSPEPQAALPEAA
jgi:integrase